MHAHRLEPVIERLTSQAWTRILAFGSSNTERHIWGMHWLDWFELGIRNSCGRTAHVINAGLGGDTVDGLHRRFDDHVAVYQPQVVIITIGGNDANRQTDISPDHFAANLQRLADRVRAIDAYPVFQTYYAQDLEQDTPERANRFLSFMQIVREVASATGSGLVDHLYRWEPLRQRDPLLYNTLMLDRYHVNDLGNQVLGLDLVKAFRMTLSVEVLEHCARGVQVQEILGDLEAGG